LKLKAGPRWSSNMSPLHGDGTLVSRVTVGDTKKSGICRSERYQAPRKGSLCVIEHIGTAVRNRDLMLRRCDTKSQHVSGSRLSEGIKAQKSVTSMEGAICVPTAAWSTKPGKLSTRLKRGCCSAWTGVSTIYQQAERKSAVFSKGNPVFSTSNWDHTKPTSWNAPSSSHCPDEAGPDDCFTGAALPETVAALTCPRAWLQRS
jgi:hypothetical protein